MCIHLNMNIILAKFSIILRNKNWTQYKELCFSSPEPCRFWKSLRHIFIFEREIQRRCDVSSLRVTYFLK